MLCDDANNAVKRSFSGMEQLLMIVLAGPEDIAFSLVSET